MTTVGLEPRTAPLRPLSAEEGHRARHAARTRAARAVLVELVGPWGAGKTSVVRAIVARHPAAMAAPAMWELSTPLLALGGIQMLPAIAALFAKARRPLWADLRRLVRFRALVHNLARLRRSGDDVVVIEDGPAVLLSWLRATAHRYHGGRAAPWWGALVRRWSRTVDIVVYIDAPLPLLVERVLTRAQANPYKGRPSGELAAVLDGSRAAYAEVRADLEANPGPRTLAFRSDTHSVEEIASAILATIAVETDGR